MIVHGSSALRKLLPLLALASFPLLAVDDTAVAQKKQGGKKEDKTKIESKPKDERVYPKVEPLVQLKGHEDRVNAVLFTPDGKSLVTVSRDKTVRFWDHATGKEVRKIKDGASTGTALAVSPDGGKLATAGGIWQKDKKQWVGEINIYNVAGGKLNNSFLGHADPIEAVAFNSDGSLLVTASEDGTARIWDVINGKQVHNLKGHVGALTTVAFSSDGKRIATGGVDKAVKIWDPANGSELKTLEGPKRAIGSVTFSKDGKLLAVGSQDGTVTIWDATDFKQVSAFQADDGVLAVAFSPDGSKLATGGWELVVKIWDVRSGKEIGGLVGHTEAISAVVFSPTGDRVASASLDRTVRIWHVGSAKEKAVPAKKDEKKK